MDGYSAVGRLDFLMRGPGLLDMNEAVQYPGRRLSFAISTDLGDEDTLDLLEPVEGNLEAVSTGNALLVGGKFRTKAVLDCARCGRPLEVSLEFEMEDDFLVEGVPSSFASDGYARVVAEEPFQLFTKNALIQDVYVRQGVIVNLPAQPLCEFGWDGPCPHAAERAGPGQAHGHPAMLELEKFRSEAQD